MNKNITILENKNMFLLNKKTYLYKSIVFIFLLIITLGLVSCDDSKIRLDLVTGKPGGTYYPLGSSIAEVISDHSQMISINSYKSMSGQSNESAIRSGKYQLALVQNNVAYWAKEGIGHYRKERVSNMKAITCLYQEAIQIIVNEKGNIDEIKDLKGKKIAIGDKYSGTYLDALEILRYYKITIDDINPIYCDFETAIEMLEKGDIDGTFITSGVPTASILRTSQQFDLRILSINPDDRAYMRANNSFYKEITIHSEIYPAIKYDVDTLSSSAMLVCNSDLSDEVVYDLTKSFWEHKDDLIGVDDNVANISLDTALDGLSIELHPGAIKYYKEVGLLEK